MARRYYSDLEKSDGGDGLVVDPGLQYNLRIREEADEERDQAWRLALQSLPQIKCGWRLLYCVAPLCSFYMLGGISQTFQNHVHFFGRCFYSCYMQFIVNLQGSFQRSKGRRHERMQWRQDILQDTSKVEVSNLVGAESLSSYRMMATLL